MIVEIKDKNIVWKILSTGPGTDGEIQNYGDSSEKLS